MASNPESSHSSDLWIPGSRRRGAPRNDGGGLLRRLLDRRHPGQDDLDLGAAARLGIQVEPPAQPVGHDAVDDMQAEPGAALVPPGGEEWIERPPPDVETHAD